MSPIQIKLPFIGSRFVQTITLVCTILTVVGCMGSYGRFSLDARVGQSFTDGRPDAAYRYNYAGRETMPYAIIGIDRTYSVPSRHWITFEPEPEKLRKMSDNMYGKMGYPPTGAHIVDPDGNTIGIWFSSLYTQSVRVDSEQRTIELLFRNPENSRSLSLGMAGDDS